ncbi:protein C12orf4 homolog [Gigantopelta aegis]|uniref:protein C12orf4 homolog n=1 Tax=Gigantopelta aegis TaxID=1735272 RepID=UPI001B88CEE9|nr:protein C12orf4 homolog [Gigantopelta aegis]
MSASVEKEFVFTFRSKNLRSTLTVPVTIPLPTSVSEFVGRVVLAHNLPCFVEHELKELLDEFVTKETAKLHDENAEEVMMKVKNGSVSAQSLIDRWNKAFTQEVKEFARPEEVSNEQVFSEVYHSLIHSPALETLLNLEHTYAMAMDDIIEQRNLDLEHLDNTQRGDMEEALKNVGSSYTDENINQLAQRHFDSNQLISSKWVSELFNYRNHLCNEAREEFIMLVFNYRNRLRNLSTTLPEAEDAERQAHTTRLEESFTIHLGAQMKTTHNLRLVCTDVLDFCRHKPHTVGGVMIPEPQRLQTAMSLYSTSLCGLILLVDNRPNSYTGIKRDFAKVCEQSTDFHFPDLDDQFAVIQQELITANEMRGRRSLEQDADEVSIKSTGSVVSNTSNSSGSQGRPAPAGPVCLETGDWYVTKHSNLSEVHAVFHLVVDGTARSSDISSRHPVILSIRNIIKLCFRYNIDTLTIPLLLTHEMSEVSRGETAHYRGGGGFVLGGGAT